MSGKGKDGDGGVAPIRKVPCAACGQLPGTKRCGGCKYVMYCSSKCQTAHWKDTHKKECKLIKAKIAMLQTGTMVPAKPTTAPTNVALINQHNNQNSNNNGAIVPTPTPTPPAVDPAKLKQKENTEKVLKMIEAAKKQLEAKDLNSALKGFYDTHKFCLATYGEANQETIWCGDMIANIHAERNDLDGSASQHRKNLALKTRVVGADHPIVLQGTLQPLSDVLLKQNKLAEAADILRHLFESCKKTYGLKSPHTGCAASNLGLALDGLQEYKEAVDVGVQALDICNEIWGANGLNTLKTKCNLSRALFNNDQPEEAATVGTDALEACLEALGEDHTLTKKNGR